MKKVSYKSRPVNKDPIKPLRETLSVKPPEEGYSAGSPGGGIGRGLSLPGEPTQAFDPDSEAELQREPKFRSKKIDSKKLKDLFVMLGDELDKSGEHSMANFADFMLNKIASQEELDYSRLFKDLLVKIVESDILDKNKLIISLVEIFNRVTVLNFNNNQDLGEAKLEAYQAAVARARQYVK